MEILEAFDLTKSYRDAAELANCSPSTVARYVEARSEGKLAPPQRGATRSSTPTSQSSKSLWRRQKARSGQMSCTTSSSPSPTGLRTHDTPCGRSCQEVLPGRPSPPLSAVGARARHVVPVRLVRRPVVRGEKTWLFCAWLAWSCFCVVLAVSDKTLATLICCIDQCLHRFGGVPTYALSDNERTVTIDTVARIPVRHPELVKMGRHYGLTIASCVVSDPESKGGSEATVRIAEADLVPTDAEPPACLLVVLRACRGLRGVLL